ncbi:Phosphopantetheine attachment site [Mycobacteroides abscessus subsp. abscessus]|uniref:Alanine-phosphoribitol ligase n=1 Tax=Bacillus infantis TaxID=324767 RepID=A0A5D4SFQ1_9BACI|nr:phosphopantetheine-binding protein [Bacillus infantis]TYS60626.1 alanine-phosphoribitol ligase [Bacillus infantis]SIA43721.1 Phosphopantetheine attachment site [Mycobacteroides abscessus subsp. abscessus]
MFKPEDLIKIVQDLSGCENVDLDTTFAELGLDSTSIVEILIEIELILDKDVLDADLDFDYLVSVKDVYDYANRL